MARTCLVLFQKEYLIFLFFPVYFDGWEEKKKEIVLWMTKQV